MDLRETVRQAIYQVLAEEVTGRVLQKLADRQKMALVVFTGSTIGFEEALEQMKILRGEGFCFDALCTYNAAQLLDTEKIRAVLNPGQALQSIPDGTPEQFASLYPTIIVPSMTIYTAAHIAGLTPESAAARVICHGLMKGRNVIINVDGCCPDNPARWAKGYRMAEPMKARLRANIETMRDYGATLAASNTLAARTLKAIGAPAVGAQIQAQAAPADTAASAQAPAQPAASPAKGTGRVVGYDQVACLPPGATLQVAKGAMVTALAQDNAKARGIEIVYK